MPYQVQVQRYILFIPTPNDFTNLNKFNTMIRQELFLEPYDWHVRLYYAVDAYYIDEIVNGLVDIGCKGDFLERALQNMASRKLNNGITYSNLKKRESVVVIALTSSASQFLNSLVHEVRHLANNICEASDIDLRGEESCYVSGDIVQEIYPFVRALLCEHCRHQTFPYST